MASFLLFIKLDLLMVDRVSVKQLTNSNNLFEVTVMFSDVTVTPTGVTVTVC